MLLLSLIHRGGITIVMSPPHARCFSRLRHILSHPSEWIVRLRTSTSRAANNQPALNLKISILTEIAMNKYFTRSLQLGAIALAIGLATGMGPIDDAKATIYNGLTSTKPATVVEIGVPWNTLPLAIISHGPVL